MRNEERVALEEGEAINMGEGVITFQEDEYGVVHSVFHTKADLEKLLGMMA